MKRETFTASSRKASFVKSSLFAYHGNHETTEFPILTSKQHPLRNAWYFFYGAFMPSIKNVFLNISAESKTDLLNIIICCFTFL